MHKLIDTMFQIRPLPQTMKTDLNDIYIPILTSDQKIENVITCAIHFFDKTIFTNPGPATEQDSIISDCGRLLRMAYINKKHAYMILFQQQQKKSKSMISKLKCKNVVLYLSNCLGTLESYPLPFHLCKQTHCIITAPPCMNLNITNTRSKATKLKPFTNNGAREDQDQSELLHQGFLL